MYTELSPKLGAANKPNFGLNTNGITNRYGILQEIILYAAQTPFLGSVVLNVKLRSVKILTLTGSALSLLRTAQVWTVGGKIKLDGSSKLRSPQKRGALVQSVFGLRVNRRKVVPASGNTYAEND
jgi:hypothetical protein